jgi:hypothetical protein
MPINLKELNDNLWKSADDLRANSDLKSSEYSTPVMGLIFLKFAGVRLLLCTCLGRKIRLPRIMGKSCQAEIFW